MAHNIDMVMDFQYGSTGKGLIAGWLAKRKQYDTVVCSFAPNAGHTYIDKSRDMHVMTQQLPTGAISSNTVKKILIGPGALIHVDTLINEIDKYHGRMAGKDILIHPHAAIVTDEHAEHELFQGYTRIGSTAKGVGAAAIQRIKRDPQNLNIARDQRLLTDFLVTPEQYQQALQESQNLLVEGAQGYSLSMYHGQYPYTTSRDVTPWQIAADCGLPYKMAPYIQVIGTARTYPIRVSNRDGSSGPCYPDQREISWKDIGIEPELTTVTKLPRRVFTFSKQQIDEAVWHCGGYWKTRIFLNFCNYLHDEYIGDIIRQIETPTPNTLNSPRVEWLGFGPDDADVRFAGE